MKEVIKQKMMNRLHRRNSSSSSTASVDYTSGERLKFTFSTLQGLQVPKGWDKLSVSLVSVETGKTIAKTGRASARNGNCQWTENLSEYIWVPHEDASKGIEQCLYKLLMSMGSGRSGILGEVTVNLLAYLSSESPISIAQPLKNCSYGTILQVEIRCLTPRANLRNERWTDTDSFVEDTNTSDDLDNTSDVSDSRITKSVGSSTSINFLPTSQAVEFGSRDRRSSAGGSHSSFDSMDDSFGRQNCSPHRSLSEVENDLIRRQDSIDLSNSAQYSSYHFQDSPRSSRSPNLGPGKQILNQRQDPEKHSYSIPASPLRTSKGSTEFFLEAEGATVEELRTEARMWERNARKLKVDLDFSRKELKDQTRKLENATMENLALQTECDGLKHEINYLKVLLDELAVKERAGDSPNVLVHDKIDIQTELEEEIQFQRELNENLSLQLNKTQESNLELVSVLQELEETIEKQRLEIESHSKSTCRHEGCGEADTMANVSDKKISIEKSTTDFQVKENDQWNPELQLQQFLESQRTTESTILYLEKIVKEKTREIEFEKALKAQTLLDNESEWMKKLSLKDEEIFNLEEKLSEAYASQVPKKIETYSRETSELVEVEALKNKIQELERDCNELTEENLELLFKLKESSTISCSQNGLPGSKIPSIEYSEMIKLECQIQQLKEEAKKRELDIIEAGSLQIRCNDLESKCEELEINNQGFKDKACDLNDELDKYRKKVEEQENEVSALKQKLKLQKGQYEREGQAEVVLHHSDTLEKLNMELTSRVEDLGKELLAKTSEIEVLKADCLLKDKTIQQQNGYQRDLETKVSDLQSLKSQMKGTLKAMQSESTIISECLDKVKNDMEVLNHAKDSQIAANKILETKLLELESCNKELELHVAELEVENLHLSERISGLEPQLRYLTDARETSRLEIQHSETRVVDLQAEIKRLEEEIETNKADTRQKLQDLQKRWLEAQEECEYLKKANPKLQTTAENLIEECSTLQKSNQELRQQRLDLYNRCTVLEAELKESQQNFSKLSRNMEDLEDRLSSMIEGVTTKEKMFDSELEALRLLNEEQTEKLVMGENLFNQMYSEKMFETDNLQQEVAHLSAQIYASQDERDQMASEAVHEMHVLRTDKDKLEKALEDVTEKFRSSEMKLDTIQVEYESRIQKLTAELAASKQSHGVLEANLKKSTELLENTRSNEEKLKFTVGELNGNLKHCEYQRVQLAEEISSLQGQLQKIPLLQDEMVALKNSLNDVKYENERLEASLQLITEDYKELKEERTSLLQKTSSMQKVAIELEDHKRTKVALEEQIIRLQGDLTAREALCAQDAELKNELSRLKRSNSQLQRKIINLEEEKDECMKNNQVLEEKLEQKKGLKPDEIECSTNNSVISFRSDSTSSLREYMKLTEDVEASTVDATTIDAAARIQSLESELAKALESNDLYKAQIKSFQSDGQVHQLEGDSKTVNKSHDKDASLLEMELKELQQRYLHMSLKYAEVEAEREELVLKLKAVRPGTGRSWLG